jgi:uncharacterized flavoprotein (TIGR03862 family)
MRQEDEPHVVVIGGGPAGLFAAEVASAGGARVSLYEAKPSVGRKLLVAGRGGLNLTHGEEIESFVKRYRGNGSVTSWWAECMAEFSPMMLREWAAGLGVETFEQRTGRVYPREMKAAPLLRRWVARLREQGVALWMRHRWVGMERVATSGSWRLRFESPEGVSEIEAQAVIFAMGGASWSITGSDGTWREAMIKLGISVADWQAANCGWEVDWPEDVLAVEGKPMKNAMATAAGEVARGEFMVTRYGLEGGIMYQLGPALRGMEQPEVMIDLKPDVTEEQLCQKMASCAPASWETAIQRWRLGEAAAAVFAWQVRERGLSRIEDMARLVKALPVRLRCPRPVEEAISSAGGVEWSEITDDLGLRHWPGVYVAGEMIDWEAPTGGYLMQGCFATGYRAARSALAFCR